MAFRIQRRKDINAMRVGVKVVSTVMGLYASGFMLNIVGDIMNGTSSPFYTGLKLIGWTISDNKNGTISVCGDGTRGMGGAVAGCDSCIDNCITGTSGTGILAVIGLLAVVWIVFEFVDVKI